MILKVTAITMSQKGELIFTYLPIRIDTDANSNWFLLDYYEDLDAYINTNNQEMFVHAAEYFSHESDAIKQVPTNNSSVLPHLMQPRDCFNNLVKWLVKKTRHSNTGETHTANKRQKYHYLHTGGERRCLLK